MVQKGQAQARDTRMSSKTNKINSISASAGMQAKYMRVSAGGTRKRGFIDI
jgi:hypothetical protein